MFSVLAQQNIVTLNEAAHAPSWPAAPNCFNTISREYPQLGGNYEVIHHTQLLARLVSDGELTPVNAIQEKLTYHDPCFLGRHNKVFTPPRQILEAVPAVQAEEMHRCKNRGFCCGAGGTRMWMEERIGKRINTARPQPQEIGHRHHDRSLTAQVDHLIRTGIRAGNVWLGGHPVASCRDRRGPVTYPDRLPVSSA